MSTHPEPPKYFPAPALFHLWIDWHHAEYPGQPVSIKRIVARSKIPRATAYRYYSVWVRAQVVPPLF